jgi:predicted glycoside hydrolase/deacetylase ChbG (UPF0249 family)
MSVTSIAVCADDFGMDPEVNAAALSLAGMGRLSAVACMVGAPYWHSHAAALRGLNPRNVEAGLHLDLTEYPLDSRLQRPLRQWILRTHLNRRPAPGLGDEIEAQLDTFAQAMGVPPAFVDGHEHVHEFPHVRQLLVEALARRGWKPWLRSTRRAPGLQSFKAWAIESLGAEALEQLATRHGLRHNRHLLGIYNFDDQGYLHRLREWLAVARSGDLLVCHPAARWPSRAPFPAARSQEFEVLAGAAFGRLLAEQDVCIAPLPTTLGTVGAPVAAV